MRSPAILALALAVLLPLAACGSEKGAAERPAAGPAANNADIVVMSYKGRTLTSGMYAFIFSALKTDCLRLLRLEGRTGFAEDTEAFWKLRTKSGKTFAGAATDDINTHCKMLLICGELAAEYSLSLDAAAVGEVSAAYEGYVTLYGGEAGLELYLNRFGISKKELSLYLKDRRLIEAVRDRLCSAGGPCEVTEDEVSARIGENYAKAKRIFLPNEKYVGSAAGKAEELLARLKSGGKSCADFEDLGADGADPPVVSIVCAEDPGDRYAAAVFALNPGECGVCAAEGGAYLLMRVEMTDADREALFGAVRQRAADRKFSAFLSEQYDFVRLNPEELQNYDIVTADTLQ